VEEPPAPVGTPSARRHQLLVLSARTEAALATAAEALAAHLEGHPELELADVAHTLQVGRRAFDYRRVVVAASVEEAVAALRSAMPVTAASQRRNPPLIAFFGREDGPSVN